MLTFSSVSSGIVDIGRPQPNRQMRFELVRGKTPEMTEIAAVAG